jgi:hypothetical protein
MTHSDTCQRWHAPAARLNRRDIAAGTAPSRGRLLRVGPAGLLLNASTLLAPHRPAVMLVGLPTAQAADETLTLARQGTKTIRLMHIGRPDQRGPPDPISIGIIVNLTKQTVTNLDDQTQPPLEIQSVNETRITFGMLLSHKDGRHSRSASGRIDRVTGDVEATQAFTNDGWESTIATTFSLKCRPAQRMF